MKLHLQSNLGNTFHGRPLSAWRQRTVYWQNSSSVKLKALLHVMSGDLIIYTLERWRQWDYREHGCTVLTGKTCALDRSVDRSYIVSNADDQSRLMRVKMFCQLKFTFQLHSSHNHLSVTGVTLLQFRQSLNKLLLISDVYFFIYWLDWFGLRQCWEQGRPQDVKLQDRDETETFHF